MVSPSCRRCKRALRPSRALRAGVPPASGMQTTCSDWNLNPGLCDSSQGSSFSAPRDVEGWKVSRVSARFPARTFWMRSRPRRRASILISSTSSRRCVGSGSIPKRSCISLRSSCKTALLVTADSRLYSCRRCASSST